MHSHRMRLPSLLFLRGHAVGRLSSELGGQRLEDTAGELSPRGHVADFWRTASCWQRANDGLNMLILERRSVLLGRGPATEVSDEEES